MALEAGYVIQIHREVANYHIGLFFFYQPVKQAP